MQLLPDPPRGGHSSAGRAPGLQPGGRRFDPGWLHQLPARLNEKRVMTRAHANQQRRPPELARANGFHMCWRDRATCRVVSRRCQAQRLLFNNPESFCFDAKFSSESVSLNSSLKMSRSQCESAPYPQTPWGYMVKRVSAYGGCLGGRRR